jgi:hypothetical protein
MIFGEAVGNRFCRVDGGIYKLEPAYFVRPHQVQV